MRGIAIALSVTSLVVCADCQQRRFVYEVPNGYVGWVTITFSARCRDDVTNLNGSVIKIQPNGTGCSRLRAHPRTTWVHAYYVDDSGGHVRELRSSGWGEGGMLWAQADSLDGSTYRFFIGTEMQLRAAWKAAADRAGTR